MAITPAQQPQSTDVSKTLANNRVDLVLTDPADDAAEFLPLAQCKSQFCLLDRRFAIAKVERPNFLGRLQSLPTVVGVSMRHQGPQLYFGNFPDNSLMNVNAIRRERIGDNRHAKRARPCIAALSWRRRCVFIVMHRRASIAMGCKRV